MYSRVVDSSRDCLAGEIMFFAQSVRLLALLQSVLLGAGIAAFYDVLRAVRYRARAGRVLTGCCDALFWLVLLAALFEFSVAVVPGQSRAYVLIGIGLGALVWFSLLSACMLLVLQRLFDLLALPPALLAKAGCWLWKQPQAVTLRKKTSDLVKKFCIRASIFRRKGIK